MRFAIALILLLVMIVIILSGCGSEQKMTERQWRAQYKPDDVNQASAMVVLEKGRSEIVQKEKSQGLLKKIEAVCVIAATMGAVAAVVSIFLKLSQLGIIGLALFAGGTAGVSLLELLIRHPGIFVWIGAGLLVCVGGYALYLQVVSGRFKFALGEVVKNVDDIKKSASIRTENGISVGAIQTKLAAQSPITKKLVAKFRPKEDEKT